ncbi:MAG: methylenetetrahydrofolate reductase [Clostridia bacterium]|nr:methylenetetrahydrofolate reductase [Clostridia bacterium]
MKISEMLAKKRTISFEVFPPKQESGDMDRLQKTLLRVKELKPDFISVTFGAMGNTRRDTAKIASFIKTIGVEPLAHITGGPCTPEDVDGTVSELLGGGVENILALRGDKPVAYEAEYCKYFKHATDLMQYLHRFKESGRLDFGAACYPEGHIESNTLAEDLRHMKEKQDAGADFFITQLFYDNNYYYRLVSEARRAGITAPIIPGIMPLVNPKSVKRITAMCGAAIPLDFRSMLEMYQDDENLLHEIGLNFACYQIMDLIARGAPGIHIYMMNNAQIAESIHSRLENVFGKLF